MIEITPRLILYKEEYFFRFSRSSGAGGQKVNKTNTRVELVWDFERNSSLSEREVQMIHSAMRSYINRDDQLIVSSEKNRTQLMNKEDCIAKLCALVTAAIKVPIRRIPTGPGRNARAKRVNLKKQVSDKKKNRKKVTDF